MLIEMLQLDMNVQKSLYNFMLKLGYLEFMCA
jgi:hypothetical protein